MASRRLFIMVPNGASVEAAEREGATEADILAGEQSRDTNSLGLRSERAGLWFFQGNEPDARGIYRALYRVVYTDDAQRQRIEAAATRRGWLTADSDSEPWGRIEDSADMTPEQRRPGRPRIHQQPRQDVRVALPVDLIAAIDAATSNRTAFIESAVRMALSQLPAK